MATQVYERSESYSARSPRASSAALPGVEVLAVELSGPERFTRLRRPPAGGRPRSVSASPTLLRELPRRYSVDVSSPGHRAAAPQRPSTSATRSAARSRCAPQGSRKRFRGEVVAAGERAVGSSPRTSDEQVEVPYDDDRAGKPDRRGRRNDQEIIEAVREIEREKGIEGGDARSMRSRTRCSPPTRRRRAPPVTRRSSSTTRATSASTRSSSRPTSRSG